MSGGVARRECGPVEQALEESAIEVVGIADTAATSWDLGRDEPMIYLADDAWFGAAAFLAVAAQMIVVSCGYETDGLCAELRMLADLELCDRTLVVLDDSQDPIVTSTYEFFALYTKNATVVPPRWLGRDSPHLEPFPHVTSLPGEKDEPGRERLARALADLEESSRRPEDDPVFDRLHASLARVDQLLEP